MNTIMHNQFFRDKLFELQNKLKQARCMIPNHMPSLGFIAEAILRDFLKTVLPHKVTIGQGFVEYNGELSYQCDIILYDAINYAPLYSCGDIIVVPRESVFAVIEVKTSIDAKRFSDTMDAFNRLTQLGLTKKFLFIYDGCKISTLRKYFLSKYVDQDDFECLPDAIVSLNKDDKDYYLAKGLVVTDSRDMMGYMSFKTYDNTNKSIACLQEFVDKLIYIISPQVNDNTIPPLNELQNKSDDELKTIIVNDGFGLFDM